PYYNTQSQAQYELLPTIDTEMNFQVADLRSTDTGQQSTYIDQDPFNENNKERADVIVKKLENLKAEMYGGASGFPIMSKATIWLHTESNKQPEQANKLLTLKAAIIAIRDHITPTKNSPQPETSRFYQAMNQIHTLIDQVPSGGAFQI